MTQSNAIRDRGPAFWLGLVSAVSIVLLYIANVLGSLGLDDIATTWSDLLASSIAGVTLQGVITVIFWISFIALVALLVLRPSEPGAAEVEIGTPGPVKALLYNTRAGSVWLPVRLFVGFVWLASGIGKLSNPAWQDGSALRGFWTNIVTVPEGGQSAIAYEWYANFIQFLLDNGAETWFTWVVMLGETAIGLGLLVGLLTGMAAFFGAFMNMAFMLAGSAGSNPVLFALAMAIVLAWRVAGWYGLDRYIMRRFITPPAS